MENEKAKSEAKALLDKFGKDLKDVKISNSIKRIGDLRNEKNGENCDVDSASKNQHFDHPKVSKETQRLFDVEFRTIMFKNAKRKNDMYLLLEKGSW